MPKPALYRIWQSYDENCEDPTIIRYTAPVHKEEVQFSDTSSVKAGWCCTYDECGVGDLQITWQPREHLPLTMQCPACGSRLAFRHYLEERALEPVDWTGVSRKSA